MNYHVYPITSQEAKQFIKNWHYSGTCPVGTYRFGLFDGELGPLIGAAVFGQVIGRNQAQYWYDNPDKLIELRRLALIDDTPKNAETYFISRCLKWLKQNTCLEAVLSLADQNHEHTGTIYKAANFQLLGETPKDGHPRIFIDGTETHPRTMFNQHGSSSIPHLKAIYGQRLEAKPKLPKLVYIYHLHRRKWHKKPDGSQPKY